MPFKKSTCRRAAVPMMLILICACAATRTSMTSVSDPNYAGTEVKNLLISCPIEDLETRSFVEGAFSARFQAEGIATYRAMDLFPPLRDYAITEIADSLLSVNVEAILVVAITDFWQTSQEILGRTVSTTSESSTTSGSLTSVGLGSMLQLTTRTSSKTTTHNIPGITLTQENVRLDVRVYALAEGKLDQMVWRGNSTTVGNYFAGGSKVMKDAASKTVSDLQLKRILWSRPWSSDTSNTKPRIVIDAYGMPRRVGPEDSTSGNK